MFFSFFWGGEVCIYVHTYLERRCGEFVVWGFETPFYICVGGYVVVIPVDMYVN